MPMYYPPPGFHFRVEVLGFPSGGNDSRFSEVGGLAVELATEEVVEGGENRFVHKFPVRAKYPELVLKRGLLVNSEVIDWVRRCLETLPLEPRDVDVKLLNESHEPLMTWHVVGAYPTRWSVSDFQASTSGVVVETLQFYYQRFSVDRS
jgi:phage tail-like protein